MSSPLLTIADLAQLLRTTPSAIHAARYRGLDTVPPAHKIGNRLLWFRDDVNRWLQQKKETPHS